jgi:hypothetical protein
MAQLHFVEGSQDDSRCGDIVFVHGLHGHWRGTWTNDAGEFWPTWLAAEIPQAGIWSVEYDAAWLGWTGAAMPILHRAR